MVAGGWFDRKFIVLLIIPNRVRNDRELSASYWRSQSIGSEFKIIHDQLGPSAMTKEIHWFLFYFRILVKNYLILLWDHHTRENLRSVDRFVLEYNQVVDQTSVEHDCTCLDSIDRDLRKRIWKICSSLFRLILTIEFLLCDRIVFHQLNTCYIVSILHSPFDYSKTLLTNRIDDGTAIRSIDKTANEEQRAIVRKCTRITPFCFFVMRSWINDLPSLLIVFTHSERTWLTFQCSTHH